MRMVVPEDAWSGSGVCAACARVGTRSREQDVDSIDMVIAPCRSCRRDEGALLGCCCIVACSADIVLALGGAFDFVSWHCKTEKALAHPE